MKTNCDFYYQICQPGKSDSTNEAGFSLIGALMAMVIFTVGILAVFGLQTQSVRSAGYATQLTESSTWAQDEIETLVTALYDDPAFEPPYGPGDTVDPMEQVNCKDNSAPGGMIHQQQQGPYTIKWVVFTSDHNGMKIDDFNTIKDDEMFDGVDKTQTLLDIPAGAKLVSVYVSHPSGKAVQYAFVKANI